MTLKIFKINTKTGLGSPESGVKDAYSVIIFKQEAVHVKSKIGTGPLDPESVGANGASVFVVAKLKDGSVKSDSLNLSLVASQGCKVQVLPEWDEERCFDFAEHFLTLEFWDCQAKEQAEVMLSSMINSTCQIVGGVEFIEQTSKRDKLSAIYAISLFPEVGSSVRTLDNLDNWNAASNAELSELLVKCSNRDHFAYVNKS
jgi:hypothetical protein